MSLSNWRLEMELGGTSALWSHQCELGGRTLEQLRQDAEVSAKHHDSTGIDRQGYLDEEEICHGNQGLRQADGHAQFDEARNTPAVELHDSTKFPMSSLVQSKIGSYFFTIPKITSASC